MNGSIYRDGNQVASKQDHAVPTAEKLSIPSSDTENIHKNKKQNQKSLKEYLFIVLKPC